MTSYVEAGQIFIRHATCSDIPDIQAIERSASHLFQQSPYPELSAFSPISVETYQTAFCCDHPILIAEYCQRDQSNNEQKALKKAGFAYGLPWGDGLHLQEISVHADFQRLGIGKTLLSAFILVAKHRSSNFISLTTYSDIAWNAPFYQSFGFQTLARQSIPKHLETVLQREIDQGANAATRIAMLLNL